MKISQKQFHLLFFTAFLSLNFLTFPSRLTDVCGSDGIICLIITSVIAYGATYVTLLFMSKYPGETFFGAMTKALGKTVAIIFYVLYLAHLFIFITYCTRLISDQVSVYMLREYPIWFIEGIFLISVIFLCFKRTKTFGNLAQILFYFIVVNLLMLTFMIFQNVDLENMLPLFTSGISEYAMGTAVTSSYLFSAVLAMPFIIPHVEDFDRKKASKFFAFAIAGVLLIYVIYYVMCISTLGKELCAKLVFAATSIMESNRNKSFILERYEILLLTTVIFLCYIYTATMMKCFKLAIDKTAEKRKLFYILSIAVIVATTVLLNYRDIGIVIIYFFEASNITAPYVILPYLVYACYALKQRRARKK